MSNATVQVGPTQEIAPGRSIVRALVGGTLGNDDVKLVQAWADGLNAAITKLHTEAKQPVGVLIDLRSMETYTNPQIVPILVKLMKDDNPHVLRTATFGGNVVHEMIERIISSLANRNNLKNFKTEDEALAWLRE
jgi:hypothetical protein